MASEELAEIEGQISDIFRALSNGFQKLEKIKEPNRQSRQLEELTDKMRECKRLIKEFDRELKETDYKNDPTTSKMLNEKKQSMIKELNSYVALKKQSWRNIIGEYSKITIVRNQNWGMGKLGMQVILTTNEWMSSRVRVKDLQKRMLLASNMSNQQLMDHGNQMMDETDQAIDRAKKVVLDTIDVGTETAAALKAQTEQMSRIVNELDSIHFSLKRASQLVKEIGRQVATDRCIMALLFLIVMGVIAIIIVKAKYAIAETYSLKSLAGVVNSIRSSNFNSFY
ncbi:UNVERIFIED_CONTAM: putative plant SNARE 11 [Sesamum latifolium]|uniref:Plant SNARE 11 n=1 Tax=Sesamum latifolium TaxID=2727402 RepID=A0AAW2WX30_9LAMI